MRKEEYWEEGGGGGGRGGVESLGVVSGGMGSRRNENLGRKEAETRQMGLMGANAWNEAMYQKNRLLGDGEVKRLTVQWG